jgi:hypothetical protein
MKALEGSGLTARADGSWGEAQGEGGGRSAADLHRRGRLEQ